LERGLKEGRQRSIGSSWDEAVWAAVQHEGGIIFHDIMGLDMEIAENCVRLPTAKETKVVNGNIAIEEGHRTGHPKRFSIDISQGDARRCRSR
jgi:hypothetical protein